jgi:Fe-S cluster assembly iron-binding protein IscA
MLSVTKSAVDELKGMLTQTAVEEDKGLRLIHEGEGRLGLTVDSQHDGDQVVEDEARPVLFVEPELAQALDGSTLDAVETPQGPQLRLIGPEAE